MLTHHFVDKDDLLTAVLQRLDEVQHAQLRTTEGWMAHARCRCDRPGLLAARAGAGAPRATRLIREVDGLAAGGPLGGRVPKFLAYRVEFVAEALATRGLSLVAARVHATFLTGEGWRETEYATAANSSSTPLVMAPAAR